MIQEFRDDDQALRRWPRMTTGYVLNVQQHDGPCDPVVLHTTVCRNRCRAASCGP